jgi:hypothetical protein
LALAAMLAASPLLSGCIAAAIPLAAGAAMATSGAGRGDAKAGAGDTSASARSDLTVVRTSLTALPPPDSFAPAADPAVASFLEYASAQVEIRAGMGPRPSAIVPAADELRPARADCGTLPAAVFVDLDPGRGSFDPLAPGEADLAMRDALATLREKGATIVWFSRLGDSFAPAVRTALVEGGLDRAGEDRLVLMRGIDERKQTRRDELAKQMCPIAMLGDERADFDELYLYLKRPEDAIALDAMIGRGWFLASPFHTAGPDPIDGVTP